VGRLRASRLPAPGAGVRDTGARAGGGRRPARWARAAARHAQVASPHVAEGQPLHPGAAERRSRPLCRPVGPLRAAGLHADGGPRGGPHDRITALSLVAAGEGIAVVPASMQGVHAGLVEYNARLVSAMQRHAVGRMPELFRWIGGSDLHPNDLNDGAPRSTGCLRARAPRRRSFPRLSQGGSGQQASRTQVVG
jgi:hypothetical protein